MQHVSRAMSPQSCLVNRRHFLRAAGVTVALPLFTRIGNWTVGCGGAGACDFQKLSGVPKYCAVPAEDLSRCDNSGPAPSQPMA